MLNWTRRRQRRQRVCKSQGREARTFRPTVEGLEERALLSITLSAISNQSIPAGKTLILPLQANTSDGSAVSYTISSSDTHITSQMHSGNAFFKISVSYAGSSTPGDTPFTGDMVFELFNDLTPQTVATIEGLIKSGFYNGLIFHRVVSKPVPFVIQGGDPNGDGTGGPGFQFDDEFNPNAIFSGTGQLALANAGKDTNGSQFFVTIGAQRALDFNHAIFGQLVRGSDILNKIDAVPVGANDKPLTPVVMTSVQVVPDATDAVVTFSAAAGFTGTSTITVTANDGHDAPAVQTFQLQGFTDTQNDPPILGPVGDQVTPMNTPLTFTVTGTDLENNPLTFEAVNQDSATNATITVTQVNNNSATVTVTPNSGFTGPIHIKVGVKDANATDRNEPNSDPFDTQNITIGVGDQPLTGTTVPFNVTEGIALSSVVVGTFTDADANAQASDFTATVNWGEGDNNPAPNQPLVRLTTGQITKGSNGVFTITATKPSAYREAGLFTVKTQVVDKLGATTNILSTATVADANLTAQGVAVTASQGRAFSNVTVATFTDANPKASVTDFNASIDWGDGQTTAGTIVAGPNRNFLVQGSHMYATAGSFAITVTINDPTSASDVTGKSAKATTTATVALPSNQGLVTNLFKDILNRAPDGVGLAYFGGLLDKNLATRAQVTLAIETSPEARQDQVQNLYTTLLNRAVDPVGLSLDVQFLLKGGSIMTLREVICSSDEYFQTRGGGTNSGFLTALASDAVGHALDTASAATDKFLLDDHQPRSDFVNELFSTQEAEVKIVQGYFQQFLQRTADAVGQTTFVNDLQQGIHEEVIVMLIGGSDEFFARFS